MSKTTARTRREWIYEYVFDAINAIPEFRGKVIRTSFGKRKELPVARVFIQSDVIASDNIITESGQVGLGDIEGTTAVQIVLRFQEMNDATDDGVVIARESQLIDMVEQALYGIPQETKTFDADNGAGGYRVQINGATVTSSGMVQIDEGGAVEVVTMVAGTVSWTQLY